MPSSFLFFFLFFHPSQDYSRTGFSPFFFLFFFLFFFRAAFMLMSAIIKTCSTRNNKKNEHELETAFGGGLETARGVRREGRM